MSSHKRAYEKRNRGENEIKERRAEQNMVNAGIVQLIPSLP
jgi:hypothetical protein